MRPEVRNEVREWLARAHEDLREAEHDLRAEPPLVRGSVFHAQQAAEKAWKAFLTAHEQTFRKTHDLDELGRAATGCDPTLADVAGRSIELSPYAWRFRYPGAPADPSVAEARQAIAIAREVYDAVLARVPESARP